MYRSLLLNAVSCGALMLSGCSKSEPAGDYQVAASETNKSSDLNLVEQPNNTNTSANRAKPELSQELRDHYESIRFADTKKFNLEDGRSCDEELSGKARRLSDWREPKECRQERENQIAWNGAISEEIDRYDFIKGFEGDYNLVIPGDAAFSGEYEIYGGYVADNGVVVTKYIGESQPFISHNGELIEDVYLFPLVSISDTPGHFFVPMWNFQKRRAFQKRADAVVEWIAVNCETDRRFTNKVMFQRGDMRSANFEYIQSYVNTDDILDYHSAFIELRLLMSTDFSFSHLSSSPFSAVCVKT